MSERRGGNFAVSPEANPLSADIAVVSVPWIVAVLLRGRRLILALAVLGFVVSMIVAIFRMTYYTVTFSFVPQTAQDQSRSNGLASLAGQFGINLGAVGGQGPSAQLYGDLLSTREILGAVAQDTVVDASGAHVPLSLFLHAKGENAAVRTENTVRILRDRVVGSSVATRTSGIISVTVRTQSPQASLTIADRLLAALNEFNVDKRRSQATEERRFTEGRLAAARASLRQAEDALQSFLQTNRQYAGSPELTFQKERLERELSLQQQVVTGLAQQYEDARIREVRDTPVFTVLESPVLPVLPDPRGRATTVVLGTLGATLIGMAFILGRAGWLRQKDLDAGNPSREMLAVELQNARGWFGRS
jgi:uncharacterized protein involved in exopolysaccharide biosynthesis